MSKVAPNYENTVADAPDTSKNGLPMSEASPTTTVQKPEDSRGGIFQDLHTTPDLARQAALDAIGPTSRVPSKNRRSSRRVSPPTTTMAQDGSGSNGKAADQQPQRTNSAETAEDHRLVVESVSTEEAFPPAPQRRSSRRQHRRTRSYDVTPSWDGQLQPGYYYHEGGPPPLPGYPAPMMQHHPAMMQQQQPPPPPGSRGADLPPARRSSRRPRHQRVHSLPNDPNQPSPFFPPTPGISPAGNPLVPFLADAHVGAPAAVPPPQFGAYGSEAFPRGGGYHPHGAYGRPRSGSFGSMPGAYGSLGQYGAPPPPPLAPPPSKPPATAPGSFSPRDELRTLTSGFKSTSPRMSGSGGGSPLLSSSQQQQSPRMGFRRSHSDRNVSFSPGTPLIERTPHSGSGSYQFGPSSGLEDSMHSSGDFSAEAGFHRRGKNHRRSAQSMRKMHMRQQSAQLFMEDIKGVQQPLACRNVIFALLFVFHLIGMVYLGSTYSREAFMVNATGNEKTVNVWYRDVIYLASICGVFAVLVSTLALIIMTMIARRLIQVSLMLTIALSFAWGTIGIGLSPKNFVPITGVIALALSVGYTLVVWDRIPFASSNLHAAMEGVRANPGTVFVAFGFQFIALVWSIYFTFVVVGVYDAIQNKELILSQRLTRFVYAMLGVSYYWTLQVLLNVVQVTVAGTVGNWWFRKETTLGDGSVSRAFFRAIFYEFGSICFGSLFVGPVRLLRQLSAFFRPSPEESYHSFLHECVTVVQQCVTGCVDGVADRFNPWALTYVGLYGYGLVDAGHNATELFRKRGWTMIVTDDLVPNVLLMVSIVIGGITGIAGTFLQDLQSLDFSTLQHPFISSFVIGSYMGLIVTSVLFGIISSSVNAVIVCFAGSPFDFEKSHPELSAEMRSAWREVWPGCMDVIDLRIEAMAMGQTPLPEEQVPILPYHAAVSM